MYPRLMVDRAWLTPLIIVSVHMFHSLFSNIFYNVKN